MRSLSSSFGSEDSLNASMPALGNGPRGLGLPNSVSPASPLRVSNSTRPDSTPITPSVRSLARHTLGLILLLLVVFLWTTSNFLGSTIFADKTYAKPFFVTYLNTSIFVTTLIPLLIRSGYRNWRRGTLRTSLRTFVANTPGLKSAPELNDFRSETETEVFLINEETARDDAPRFPAEPEHLDTWSTARLSLQFCVLWFLANYFALACLQYTTVASATILTSTSSIWTLLIGAITRTEKFTWRKLFGVLSSLAGVFLVSQVDFSTPSKTDSIPNSVKERSGLGESFPDKTHVELAFGDTLAGLSALIYGIYAITLKRTSDSAAKEGKALNMALFFGLVGLINTVLLPPLFPILSVLNIETFEPPPTHRIWTILLINSFASLASDVCWAHAMVLTSPLVVTVGLSLTIPLSLVGELVVQGRSESFVYWIGAIIVVCSFVFVDREEVQQERSRDDPTRGSLAGLGADDDDHQLEYTSVLHNDDDDDDDDENSLNFISTPIAQ